MTKRQKKSQSLKFIVSILVLLTVIISYQNCSDIKLGSAVQKSETPPPPYTPPPYTPPPLVCGMTDPKDDYMNGRISNRYWAPANLSGADLAYTWSLWRWTPTIAIGATLAGVYYPASIIAGAAIPDGTGSVGGLYPPLAAEIVLDPMNQGYNMEVRNVMQAGGTLSYRIRTFAAKKDVWQFDFINAGIGTNPGPTFHYSISKIPGEIDPAKANSVCYCNLSYGEGFTISDTPVTTPQRNCRVLQSGVYYINVLDTADTQLGTLMALGMSFVNIP